MKFIDRSGQTTIEYIISLVVVAVLALAVKNALLPQLKIWTGVLGKYVTDRLTKNLYRFNVGS